MSWNDVGASDDVASGKVHVVECDGTRVALCRTEEGLYAIEDVCSHDGSPLDQGELLGNRIECPRHGAMFDVTTGQPKSLPAVRPIRTFVLKEEDGRIKLDCE